MAEVIKEGMKCHKRQKTREGSSQDKLETFAILFQCSPEDIEKQRKKTTFVTSKAFPDFFELINF